MKRLGSLAHRELAIGAVGPKERRRVQERRPHHIACSSLRQQRSEDRADDGASGLEGRRAPQLPPCRLGEPGVAPVPCEPRLCRGRGPLVRRRSSGKCRRIPAAGRQDRGPGRNPGPSARRRPSTCSHGTSQPRHKSASGSDGAVRGSTLFPASVIATIGPTRSGGGCAPLDVLVRPQQRTFAVRPPGRP